MHRKGRRRVLSNSFWISRLRWEQFMFTLLLASAFAFGLMLARIESQKVVGIQGAWDFVLSHLS